MKEHADRLLEITRLLKKSGWKVGESASHYFDGLMSRNRVRVPFLVTKRFIANYHEYKEYFNYHLDDYTFIMFEFDDLNGFKIYHHRACHGFSFSMLTNEGLMTSDL